MKTETAVLNIEQCVSVQKQLEEKGISIKITDIMLFMIINNGVAALSKIADTLTKRTIG